MKFTHIRTPAKAGVQPLCLLILGLGLRRGTKG